MSEEVLRFYQRGARGGKGLRLRPKRPPIIRYTLLALLIGIPTYAWWTTRDTWPMGRLIPKDQHYALLFPDLIEGRKVIARSPLWEAVPEQFEARKFQEMLQQDFGLPEWLINNVAVGAVHISGKDTRTFSDALLVTRMTRLGALLQRFSGYSDALQEDYAGGLELRHVPEAGLWLAVRGRVMLASRDRQALIDALVLPEGEALGEGALEETLESAEQETLQARLHTDEVEWAAPHISAAGIQCWLSDDAARVVLTCRLSDAARERLAPLLAKAKPVALQPAIPGPLSIAADLGMPAAEAWQQVAALAGGSFDAAATLEGLVSEQARATAGPALRAAVEALGSQWSITYRGLNEMAFAPMPYFAAQFNANPALLRDFVRGFPPLPQGVGAWESVPRPSEDGRYVELPLIGGDDLHPVLAPLNGRLMVATAKQDGIALLDAPAPAESNVTGNICVTLQPAALLQDGLDLALQLAELRLVRGQNTETLPQTFAPWQQAAAKVSTASLIASHEDGTVVLDLRLGLAR